MILVDAMGEEECGLMEGLRADFHSKSPPSFVFLVFVLPQNLSLSRGVDHLCFIMIKLHTGRVVRCSATGVDKKQSVAVANGCPCKRLTIMPLQ